MLPAKRSRIHVRRHISGADRGGFRRARRIAEVGIVSTANMVGLILATAVALLLVAALLFPEKF
ncbi:hypothetical protein BST16_19900 [Mycobacterium asiaticum DSM 44297]|nr:hypothetical protein BST16_19900 [Mycobacterium asiaticum DSM 44297]